MIYSLAKHSYPTMRSPTSSLIRPILLHENLLVDLAHGIAFDGLHDLQDRGYLIRCQLFLEFGAQGRQVQLTSLEGVNDINEESEQRAHTDLIPESHNCSHPLAPFIVFQPDNRHLLDRIQRQHLALDLQSGNLIPTRLDDIH